MNRADLIIPEDLIEIKDVRLKFGVGQDPDISYRAFLEAPKELIQDWYYAFYFNLFPESYWVKQHAICCEIAKRESIHSFFERKGYDLKNDWPHASKESHLYNMRMNFQDLIKLDLAPSNWIHEWIKNKCHYVWVHPHKLSMLFQFEGTELARISKDMKPLIMFYLTALSDQTCKKLIHETLKQVLPCGLRAYKKKLLDSKVFFPSKHAPLLSPCFLGAFSEHNKFDYIE